MKDVISISSTANHYERMATQPIRGLILKMAIPSILSMLVQSVYSMADTYFVGQLPGISDSATAAVTLVSPLFIVIQAVGLAFGLGGGSYISRLLGEERREDASRVLSTCLHSSWAIGLLLCVLGIFFINPLVSLLAATDTSRPLAIEYAAAMLWGAPLMCSCFVMNNALRAEGNAVLSTVGMVSGALLNIALDPLCIYTFGWGVRGAAIATVFSQGVSTLILLWFYVGKKSQLSISSRYFTPKPALYNEVFKIGIPTFLRNILGAASSILIAYAANPYGDTALAGIGIVARFSWVVFSFLLGFTMAYMPVSGFNYGARRYSRVREAYQFSLRVSVIFMTISGVVIFALSTPIANLLNSDPAVSAIGERVMRAQALSYPLVGWAVLINMLFESLGKGRPATILSLGRQGVFLMLAVLVMVPLWGLDGLIFVQPVADALFFLLAVPMSWGMLRELKALRDDPVEAQSLDSRTDGALATPLEA